MTNRDLNHFAAHTALHEFAWGVSSAFSAVFLLRQGLSPTEIYFYIGLIIAFRFIFRPAVLFSVAAFGLRTTVIFGTFLYALQSPLLALVHGPGIVLLVYCVISATGQVFYWACYHAMFACIGDTKNRGSQVALRQLLIGIVGIMGPAVGGLMLTVAGPGWAFGVAAAFDLLAILPLRELTEPSIASIAPKGTVAAAKRGVLMLATDGWIFNSSGWAWSLVIFEAVGTRYYAFGGALAIAALAGALGGLVLGRFIDTRNTRWAALINAVVLTATLLAKSLCGDQPIPVLVVMIGTAMLGGLYMPSLMTAVYNEAKSAPCPLRYHIAAEAGWDIGGAFACLFAAVLYALGASLQNLILLALPMVAVQTFFLNKSYAARRHEIGMVGRELPEP